MIKGVINFFKKYNTWALNITLAIFTFTPEKIFSNYKLLSKVFSNTSDEVNTLFNRILIFIVLFFLNAIYLRCLRKKICIKGKNYSIQIEYGNLLEMRNCKKVITFDECFTTSIGDLPSQIKADSICGQYLQKNPIQDMQTLIDNAQLEPAETKSKYQNKERYDSGKLVPNNDYLLMSFAKLDEDGKGQFFSYDEFIECLSTLWKEIDKYYAQKDVCIPILGSGITRINGTSLTKQELLDIIIVSYKLSNYKIKPPYKLHIVCKKSDDFSLNKIGENL